MLKTSPKDKYWIYAGRCRNCRQEVTFHQKKEIVGEPVPWEKFRTITKFYQPAFEALCPECDQWAMFDFMAMTPAPGDYEVCVKPKTRSTPQPPPTESGEHENEA
jgi:hypothetical protein